jgi:hypothetical protein
MQDKPKFTQIENIGLKICRLATLVHWQTKNGSGRLRSGVFI